MLPILIPLKVKLIGYLIAGVFSYGMVKVGEVIEENKSKPVKTETIKKEYDLKKIEQKNAVLEKSLGRFKQKTKQ